MMSLSVIVVSFCCLATVSSVQQYPQATSYVYRSDHGVPGSYINVGPKDGAAYYHQPQVFAAHIPVVAAPSYAKIEPIVEEKVYEEEASEDNDSHDNEEGDADDYDGDTDGDDSEEEDDEDDSQENGGGNAHGVTHHSEHGETGSKGYKSHNSFHKGESGNHEADNHKGFYNKDAGHDNKYNDEADDYGKHYEASNEQKGNDFGHKKSHSKGDETTGFHKVYSKDEFKKEHVFYDNADNSGQFNKHDSGDSYHHSTNGGHKKAGHHESAHKEGSFGKAGHFKHGGYHDDDKGYAGKRGDESYYSHQGDYSKKGGYGHGKEFGYGKGH